MKFAVPVFVGGLLLTIASCSDDNAAPPEDSALEPTQVASATAVLPPVDLSAVDFRDLVYWDSLLFAAATYPPPLMTRIVTALAESDEPAYKAVLYELALYPTPYREQAAYLLVGDANASTGEVLEVLGERGRQTPADDSAAYVAFKSKLMGTIIETFDEFLDPQKPRLISAQEVVWVGVATDGIPPLDEPSFVTADEASSWIVPSDEVIGVVINGEARAYPRRIIDWHEMVNDTVGGVPVSLAYCTLCNSAILYDGRLNGKVYRFGTSGMLYRSNKLMYDRETRTLWEQYTGEPVWGDLVGQGLKLDVLPVVHTRWIDWVARHPDTKVLDINTGFHRDYGSGVAYADYWASNDLLFPAPDLSGPLLPKDTVYAVRNDYEVVAYSIAVLRERQFVEDEIDDLPVVVILTADSTGARAYAREGVRFATVDLAAGTLKSEDGRGWRIEEDALVADDGTRLTRLPGHNSFWFAVVNHAPTWRLYE